MSTDTTTAVHMPNGNHIFAHRLHRVTRHLEDKRKITAERANVVYDALLHPIRHRREGGEAVNLVAEMRKHSIELADRDPNFPRAVVAAMGTDGYAWGGEEMKGVIWNWLIANWPMILKFLLALLPLLF